MTLPRRASTLVVLAMAPIVSPAGCGSNGGSSGEVGTYDPDGGSLISGRDASGPAAVDAYIAHGHVAVTFILLGCSGGCPTVEAVGTGGHPPYTYVWEDGSTSASRQVCPASDTNYAVTVTDTGSAGEVPRAAETAQATLPADVLVCPDASDASDASDAGTARDADAGLLCVMNPSFEGTAQIDVADIVAPPWHTCHPYPDILDGKVGGVTLQPSDGKTFVELQYSPQSSSVSESVGQQLCAPLRSGDTVHLKIDASIESSGSFTVQFYGAATACQEDQLLGETAPVTTVGSWTTDCVTLHAQADASFLTVRLGHGQSVLGGIMGYVDNLRVVDSCP